MSNGQRFIVGYLTITYVLPMIGNVLFGSHIVSSYKIYPLTSHSVLLIVAVYVLFLFLSTLKAPLLLPLDMLFIRTVIDHVGRFYNRYRPAIGLIALSIGLMNLLTGLSGYRYSNEGISERSAIVFAMLLLTIILHNIITVDLFYCMFVSRKEGIRVFSRRYLEAILLAVSLIVIANGIMSLLVASVTLFCSLCPLTFHQLIFVPRCRRGLKVKTQTITLIPVFLFIFAMAWFFGSIIKLSSGTDITVLLTEYDPVKIVGFSNEDSIIERIFYNLIERCSIFYYSFLFTVEALPNDINHGITSVIVIPLQTLLFRIDCLLGRLFEVARPEIGTIMQLNYMLLSEEVINSREGSSPGILASFNYVFIFPLNIIFCSFYLRWASKLLDSLLRQHNSEKLSIYGVIFILMFLQGLFHSPFDYLILIDDGVIHILLLLALSIAQGESRVARVMYSKTTSYRPSKNDSSLV